VKQRFMTLSCKLTGNRKATWSCSSWRLKDGRRVYEVVFLLTPDFSKGLKQLPYAAIAAKMQNIIFKVVEVACSIMAYCTSGSNHLHLNFWNIVDKARKQ
jgi:hypothetical protein